MSTHPPRDERSEVEFHDTSVAGPDGSIYAIVGFGLVLAITFAVVLVRRALDGRALYWPILVSMSAIVATMLSIAVRTGRTRRGHWWFAAGAVIGLGFLAAAFTAIGRG